ncbi:hypothetical protein O166_07475 [Pseudogulbenkiania ferrooxidans EGD-HP2]|uniref:Uncharacterized protein n=1 Tax=Pseudogulbenkiania ferrooxidans EGD-HP2 TaxID=1388764 RepID=A0ABP2XP54_9NEIS|nr:hypothetical protein O166_07475 [Pseudogulbenkiania ferrooxidans EGD-HP2]
MNFNLDPLMQRQRMLPNQEAWCNRPLVQLDDGVARM